MSSRDRNYKVCSQNLFINSVVLTTTISGILENTYRKNPTGEGNTYAPSNQRTGKDSHRSRASAPRLACAQQTVHSRVLDVNPSSVGGRVTTCVSFSIENVALMCGCLRSASDMNYCFSLDHEPIRPKKKRNYLSWSTAMTQPICASRVRR